MKNLEKNVTVEKEVCENLHVTIDRVSCLLTDDSLNLAGQIKAEKEYVYGGQEIHVRVDVLNADNKVIICKEDQLSRGKNLVLDSFNIDIYLYEKYKIFNLEECEFRVYPVAREIRNYRDY